MPYSKNVAECEHAGHLQSASSIKPHRGRIPCHGNSQSRTASSETYAVTHPSNNLDTLCLTSVISHELVHPKCYALHNCFGPPSLLGEGLLSTGPNPSSFYLLVEMGLLLHHFPAYML